MPVKFWLTIIRFWFFLSYLITTVSEEMQEKEKNDFCMCFRLSFPSGLKGFLYMQR